MLYKNKRKALSYSISYINSSLAFPLNPHSRPSPHLPSSNSYILQSKLFKRTNTMIGLVHAAFLALTMITGTSAANVYLLACQEGDNPSSRSASTATISLKVQWVGIPEGCKNQIIYTASTGVTNPFLALREFDGDNDFSANADIFSFTPGLKVKVGDDEIALGDASNVRELTSDEERFICDGLGYGSTPLNKLTASYSEWNNVGSLGPCRD